MNTESWVINLKLASIEIKLWQKNFIKKQKEINPNITIQELDKKIRNAKREKFNDRFDYLIFEHPDYPYLNQIS
jgi:hypothetical protein